MAERIVTGADGLPQDDDDAEERYLRNMLAEIDQMHRRAAQPYIDRLVAIAAAKPPPPIIIPMQDMPEWLRQRLREQLRDQQGGVFA